VRILVLGATGLVGKAMVAEAETRGHSVVAAARRHAPLILDATDDEALRRVVLATRPHVVVNCISFGSIEDCAADPSGAYRVNARINGCLAELCREVDATLVAISTDHYFTGDGEAKHDEAAEVRLVNDYAMTKYAGEHLALANPRSLVIRTNVIGLRGSPEATFVEWVLGSLKSGRQIILFDDYYCSSIDVGSLAAGTLDLAEFGTRGILNVACRDVASKRRFVLALADRLSYPVDAFDTASVRSLRVARAESAGLDVSRAERALGRPLPSFDQVVDTIARLAKDA
jgi:dTDP-4-dehydrorhamnose reductase